MKKQFYFISTVFGLTLAMLAYNLSWYVAENNALEQIIREHTRHISATNNIFRQSAHEQLHKMDPTGVWFAKGQLLLELIDSIEHLLCLPQGKQLIQIHKRLESLRGSAFEYGDFSFLEDEIVLTDQHLQFDYYKARIISECYQKHLGWIFRTPCMCMDKFEFIQQFDPGRNEYITHFGSFMRCESKYHHVLVNGSVAPDGTFSFTPTKSGWDNILVEVERYDGVGNRFVIDTTYVPIKAAAAPTIISRS